MTERNSAEQLVTPSQNFNSGSNTIIPAKIRYRSNTRSRGNGLEARGYKFVESDLPSIVRNWCVGDSILCLTQGEFEYFDNEVWRKLKPFPIDQVLAAYTICAGLIVIKIRS